MKLYTCRVSIPAVCEYQRKVWSDETDVLLCENSGTREADEKCPYKETLELKHARRKA